MDNLIFKSTKLDLQIQPKPISTVESIVKDIRFMLGNLEKNYEHFVKYKQSYISKFGKKKYDMEVVEFEARINECEIILYNIKTK
jgi:hypothetical protein